MTFFEWGGGNHLWSTQQWLGTTGVASKNFFKYLRCPLASGTWTISTVTSSVAFENFFVESWSAIEFVTNLRHGFPLRKCRPHPSVMDRTLNECRILKIDPNNEHSVNEPNFSDYLNPVFLQTLPYHNEPWGFWRCVQ